MAVLLVFFSANKKWMVLESFTYDITENFQHNKDPVCPELVFHLITSSVSHKHDSFHQISLSVSLTGFILPGISHF